MADPSGRWWLSYNGELYNYARLKRRLAGRWAFTTKGDGQIVLAGLVLEGADFLDRMDGMWALVLWDGQLQKALLVRDRMGQKPLYYQTAGDMMACASELRALASLTWFAWREDMRSTADYLRYGYHLPGCTAFEKVHELLLGHSLIWTTGQAPTLTAYWQLPPDRFNGTRAQAGERLVDAVTRGMHRRLVADVEVGGFLSGGIDSSLIVGIVQKGLHRPLKAFTIGFDDPALDERRFAPRVARRFGTHHFDQRLSIDQGLDLIDSLLTMLAQPIGDASIMPTALVSQMASQHVKVVITGDGGDELLYSPHEIWKQVDLLLAPSLHEGMPNAVLEALANGIPVLTSDIPGHRIILPAAFCLPLSEAKRWRQKLCELMHDTSRCLSTMHDIQMQFASRLRFAWHARVVDLIVRTTFQD
jgi:asparagine synthase (glutamine-hydrolysing)